MLESETKENRVIYLSRIPDILKYSAYMQQNRAFYKHEKFLGVLLS
ncbi:hypothetical protein MGMO_435c00070 [Methyloglobulus morosus KoM1]|uniref:Uncharacterized protein n=1 Tax=Methyloglobulus morosus KoM1 TaxID=1116472 RepID=V5DED9_9GAMM|nr:hypothetical protein MGMO_435c00070 [Methyloglobulus morosus KoM1]